MNFCLLLKFYCYSLQVSWYIFTFILNNFKLYINLFKDLDGLSCTYNIDYRMYHRNYKLVIYHHSYMPYYLDQHVHNCYTHALVSVISSLHQVSFILGNLSGF